MNSNNNGYISPKMVRLSINPAGRLLAVSKDLVIETYIEQEGGSLDD